LCDPVAEVSAHWLIARDGGAEALVDEGLRAWHAGAGSWGTVTDVNSRSIGIELVNSGAEPFAAPQMKALERLLGDIMTRWSIPPERIIAHADMAPTRKSDPGPRFDWRRLAVLGLSVWPTADLVAAEPGDFRSNARRFGYPDGNDNTLLRAFRLRFRPWATGALGAEDAAMMADLARRYPAV
jgi:N-acetylmuramoyl-L-alanine amidase